MRKKINQLFFVAALLCGAISMTSCQGLIDAIVGSTDNPSEVSHNGDCPCCEIRAPSFNLSSFIKDL